MVQNIWDVCIQELSFVPMNVRERSRAACDTNDVDASWQIWTEEAEASLIRAYRTAGGPAVAGPDYSGGTGQLSSRTERLGRRRGEDGGGAGVKTEFSTDHSDEFDVTNSRFFFNNSSLAPVLRFRRSLQCPQKALRLIGMGGLHLRRWGPLAPLRLSNLGPTGYLQIFMGFTSGWWNTLNRFVVDVVRRRQTTRLQAGPTALGKTSHPTLNQWLRPDVLPLAPSLVCKPDDSPSGSGILVQPVLVDGHFRKAWMPYFRREGHPVVTPAGFLTSCGWPPPSGSHLGHAHSHRGRAS